MHKFNVGDYVVMIAKFPAYPLTAYGSVGVIKELRKVEAKVNFFKNTGPLASKVPYYEGWFTFHELALARKYHTKLGKQLYNREV